MRIIFLFYEGMTALDAVGPHEVLSRLPGAVVRCAAIASGPIQTNSGLVLQADIAISDVSYADVLVVPGAGNATTLRNFPEVLAWLCLIHKTTQWTTSVCTGSLILGAAGILSGLRATTHWAVYDRLRTWGAYPTRARVVEDGKVMTAAGVSAGIDMALTLAAKIAGPQSAQTIQLALEYDPEPPFDTGSPEKAPAGIRDALKERMLARFEDDSV